MPERVLLTGANGFVGRATSARLVRAGYDVRHAVRRSSTATGARVVGGAIAGARVVVGDIDGATDWREALDGVGAVVHLAARVHVMRDTAADPLRAFRAVNTDGTRRLAEQAAAAGVRRLVYVSSIKVNGEGTPTQPYREDDPPAPHGDYAQSKLEAEDALRAIASSTRLETVIVRPPLVYGPGVGANFLSMMRWVHRGVPLPLGAIDNRRSLVFVDNLADLLCACVEHAHAARETFLVSDGEDLSTPDLLRRIATALGVRSRLLPVPVAWLDRAARAVGKRAIFDRLCGSLQVDIGKAKRLLDWAPPCSVDDALATTAKAYLESRAR